MNQRLATGRAPALIKWAWLACLAALPIHGLAATVRWVRLWKPGTFSGRFASSDHMLAFLYMPHGTQAVMDALARTPQDEAVLFVGRAAAPALPQTYYGVGSAALPRIVADVRCGDAGEIRGPVFDPGVPYGAVVLFEPVRAIDGPGALKVGERLVVIQGRPRADLGFYCSALLPPPAVAAAPPAPAKP
jgi:hypothetical protein